MANENHLRTEEKKLAQFLKLNDLLTDDDYIVTDEEVKQAFLDHGLVPQHDPRETEEAK